MFIVWPAAIFVHVGLVWALLYVFARYNSSRSIFGILFYILATNGIAWLAMHFLGEVAGLISLPISFVLMLTCFGTTLLQTLGVWLCYFAIQLISLLVLLEITGIKLGPSSEPPAESIITRAHQASQNANALNTESMSAFNRNYRVHVDYDSELVLLYNYLGDAPNEGVQMLERQVLLQEKKGWYAIGLERIPRLRLVSRTELSSTFEVGGNDLEAESVRAYFEYAANAYRQSARQAVERLRRQWQNKIAMLEIKNQDYERQLKHATNPEAIRSLESQHDKHLKEIDRLKHAIYKAEDRLAVDRPLTLYESIDIVPR